MMYRCRRLLAVVLSLAIVASAFVFSASADDSEFSYNYLVINNNSYMIENGVAAVFDIPASSSINVAIPTLRLRTLSLNQYESLSVNFNLRAYAYYSTGTPDSWVASVQQTESYFDTSSALFLTTFQDYDREPALNKMNKLPYGIIGSFLLSSTNTINLNYLIKITNNKSFPIRIYLFFENVDIHTSWNYNMSHYLMPAILGITDSISSLNSSILSVKSSVDGVKTSVDYQNNKLFTDSYTYTQITYDSNGNASAFNVMGNWVTAVLGSLKSLVAPIKNQIDQEQKAKDAGAYDALDDAYEHSSFLSFLDFTSFADFGDYDSDDLDEINDDSYSVWFSNMTKDDLDTVAQTRGQDDNFISFYEDHMQEIEDSVGSMLGGGD